MGTPNWFTERQTLTQTTNATLPNQVSVERGRVTPVTNNPSVRTGFVVPSVTPSEPVEAVADEPITELPPTVPNVPSNVPSEAPTSPVEASLPPSEGSSTSMEQSPSTGLTDPSQDTYGPGGIITLPSGAQFPTEGHITFDDIDTAIESNNRLKQERIEAQWSRLLPTAATLYNPFRDGVQSPLIQEFQRIQESYAPPPPVPLPFLAAPTIEPEDREFARPNRNDFYRGSGNDPNKQSLGGALLSLLGLPSLIEYGLRQRAKEEREESLSLGGTGYTWFGIDLPRWMTPIARTIYSDQTGLFGLYGDGTPQQEKGILETAQTLFEGVVEGRSEREILQQLNDEDSLSSTLRRTADDAGYGAYGRGAIGLLNRVLSADDAIRATFVDLGELFNEAYTEATDQGGFNLGEFINYRSRADNLEAWWKGERQYSFLTPQEDPTSGLPFTPIRQGQTGTFIFNPFTQQELHIPFIPGWMTGLVADLATGGFLPDASDLVGAAAGSVRRSVNVPNVPDAPSVPDLPDLPDTPSVSTVNTGVAQSSSTAIQTPVVPPPSNVTGLANLPGIPRLELEITTPTNLARLPVPSVPVGRNYQVTLRPQSVRVTNTSVPTGILPIPQRFNTTPQAVNLLQNYLQTLETGRARIQNFGLKEILREQRTQLFASVLPEWSVRNPFAGSTYDTTGRLINPMTDRLDPSVRTIPSTRVTDIMAPTEVLPRYADDTEWNTLDVDSRTVYEDLPPVSGESAVEPLQEAAQTVDNAVDTTVDETTQATTSVDTQPVEQTVDTDQVDQATPPVEQTTDTVPKKPDTATTSSTTVLPRSEPRTPRQRDVEEITGNEISRGAISITLEEGYGTAIPGIQPPHSTEVLWKARKNLDRPVPEGVDLVPGWDTLKMRIAGTKHIRNNPQSVKAVKDLIDLYHGVEKALVESSNEIPRNAVNYLRSIRQDAAGKIYNYVQNIATKGDLKELNQYSQRYTKTTGSDLTTASAATPVSSTSPSRYLGRYRLFRKDNLNLNLKTIPLNKLHADVIKRTTGGTVKRLAETLEDVEDYLKQRAKRQGKIYTDIMLQDYLFQATREAFKEGYEAVDLGTELVEVPRLWSPEGFETITQQTSGTFERPTAYKRVIELKQEVTRLLPNVSPDRIWITPALQKLEDDLIQTLTVLPELPRIGSRTDLEGVLIGLGDLDVQRQVDILPPGTKIATLTVDNTNPTTFTAKFQVLESGNKFPVDEGVVSIKDGQRVYTGVDDVFTTVKLDSGTVRPVLGEVNSKPNTWLPDGESLKKKGTALEEAKTVFTRYGFEVPQSKTVAHLLDTVVNQVPEQIRRQLDTLSKLRQTKPNLQGLGYVLKRNTYLAQHPNTVYVSSRLMPTVDNLPALIENSGYLGLPTARDYSWALETGKRVPNALEAGSTDMPMLFALTPSEVNVLPVSNPVYQDTVRTVLQELGVEVPTILNTVVPNTIKDIEVLQEFNQRLRTLLVEGGYNVVEAENGLQYLLTPENIPYYPLEDVPLAKDLTEANQAASVYYESIGDTLAATNAQFDALDSATDLVERNLEQLSDELAGQVDTVYREYTSIREQARKDALADIERLRRKSTQRPEDTAYTLSLDPDCL